MAFRLVIEFTGILTPPTPPTPLLTLEWSTQWVLSLLRRGYHGHSSYLALSNVSTHKPIHIPLNIYEISYHLCRVKHFISLFIDEHTLYIYGIQLTSCCPGLRLPVYQLSGKVFLKNQGPVSLLNFLASGFTVTPNKLTNIYIINIDRWCVATFCIVNSTLTYLHNN